jgi:hypothetical protein
MLYGEKNNSHLMKQCNTHHRSTEIYQQDIRRYLSYLHEALGSIDEEDITRKTSDHTLTLGQQARIMVTYYWKLVEAARTYDVTFTKDSTEVIEKARELEGNVSLLLSEIQSIQNTINSIEPEVWNEYSIKVTTPTFTQSQRVGNKSFYDLVDIVQEHTKQQMTIMTALFALLNAPLPEGWLEMAQGVKEQYYTLLV